MNARLPMDVADSNDQLSAVIDPLQQVVGANSSTPDLVNAISDIRDQINLLDTTDLEAQLGIAKDDVALIAASASALESDIDDFISVIATFQPFMAELGTRIRTFLLPPPTEGFAKEHLVKDHASCVCLGDYNNMADYATNIFLPATASLLTFPADVTTDFADAFESASNMDSIEGDLMSNLDVIAPCIGKKRWRDVCWVHRHKHQISRRLASSSTTYQTSTRSLDL